MDPTTAGQPGGQQNNSLPGGDPRRPDTTRLEAYLRERLAPDNMSARAPLSLAAYGGEVEEPFSIELLPFGYSNFTYRLRLGERDLILRRPPPGANVRAGHDMGREYRVLAALSPVYARVPRPLLYCDDPEVFGAPFYVMERVEGVVMRKPLPESIHLTPEVMRGMSEAFIANLVAIHALDVQNPESALSALGHPEGYLQRQITGWIERYERSRTDDIPDMEQAQAWLTEHAPAQRYAALIHNDYKYDNLLFNPDDLTDIRAVLDWEMATLGDPLTDLGVTLAYWLDPDDPMERLAIPLSDNLTTLPGNLNRADLVQRYAEQSGHDVSDIVFYFVYGLYKNAVIAQQIHARYVRGLLPDPRFGRFMPAIRAIATTAVRAIEQQQIDRLG